MEDNKDTVNVEETKVEETTEKTYTKEDLDNSFNAGMKKASKELKNDESYKEFLEWKKTNQNDSEKLAELQASNDNLKKENELLKATNKVAKSDVKPEFLKFVTSEVMSLTNETTDFDKALENYKKENSQYFGEVVVKKVQTSPILNGGSKETTTNDIMNNILRSSKK
jgi:hypothetical protein